MTQICDINRISLSPVSTPFKFYDDEAISSLDSKIQSVEKSRMTYVPQFKRNLLVSQPNRTNKFGPSEFGQNKKRKPHEISNISGNK